MVIKDVRCRQFAGLQKRSLSQEFSEGLNILLGANETGKSTMIDLIHHLLFQDVNIKKNGEFQNIYFPKKADGSDVDYVRGEMTFTTDQGEYVLEKKWGYKKTTQGCELMLPDGSSLADPDNIKEILLQELVYGEGVYNEVVFASQKRVMTLLQGLFMPTVQGMPQADQKKVKVKNELSSIVTKAVMETGGIDIGEVERRLNDELLKYGKRWDFEEDAPQDGVLKRGIHNKWADATSGKEDSAKILRAYYAMEEIAEKQREAKKAEETVETVNAALESAKKKAEKVKEEREDFQKYRSVLERLADIEGRKSEAEVNLRGKQADAEEWPKAEAKYREAKELQKKRKTAQCRKLYNTVKSLKSSLEEKQKEIAEIGEVDASEVKEAFRLERMLLELSGQLKGLDLTAKIKQLGDIVPELRSIESGEELSSEDGVYCIKEAVEILIPGVLEFQLMPSEVDIEAVKKKLDDANLSYHRILQKYVVNNTEDLQKKQSAYIEAQREVQRLEEKISDQLGERDWESLVSENALLSEQVESDSEISERIRELCGETAIEGFLGIQEGSISRYEKTYRTKEELTRKIEEKEQEIKDFQNILDSLNTVPDKYREIKDAAQYDEKLRESIEDCEEKIEDLRNALADAENELGEKTAEEYAELLIEKQEDFAAQKKMYGHWKKIADVVKQVKAASDGNPMQDVAEKFRKYLGLLSKDGIALENFDEHMDSVIASGRNRLTYEILSEGTRDTIALAFRLSILEYLYPEGGGLAIFDDPFTDMDPERTAQACELIQKFAENNQVIFATCDSKYTDILDGRVIELL